MAEPFKSGATDYAAIRKRMNELGLDHLPVEKPAPVEPNAPIAPPSGDYCGWMPPPDLVEYTSPPPKLYWRAVSKRRNFPTSIKIA